MATSKPTPQTKSAAPSLVASRGEVKSKLEERLKLGRSIQSMDFNSSAELANAKDERTRWTKYNVEYLTRVFDNDSISLEYRQVGQYGAMNIRPSFGQEVQGFREGIGRQINSLASIIERLELIPELETFSMGTEESVPASLSRTAVFIVHGREDAAKTEVARFVEKLGLEAVILHERANEGLTIIEKFEKHASSVGFAVVLLTPDDVAYPKGSPSETNLRARQNVILELGYFFGKLGRNKVCAVYWPDVELPSDISGLVYVPHDSNGGWHLALAREFKRAGLTVDAASLF